MVLSRGKCPITGITETLIFSNNPLVPSVGLTHVKRQIDPRNLEQVDFFCRTFNIPFVPQDWISALEKSPNTVFETYIQYFLEKHKDNLYYTSSTADVWREANKEWEKALTHAELLKALRPVKDEFIKLGNVKWGLGYSFEELIKLEDQFTNTISAFDINNPMQIDAVKKACIASVMIDRSMQNQQIKDIKDLSAAYTQFMKLAKIDEMIESKQTDVIRTVADLADLLENNGFKPQYYDGFERDVVDKSIQNIKDYLRTLVYESTGLEETLEMISKKYQKDLKETEFTEAVSNVSLEDLMSAAKEDYDRDIDSELEKDVLDYDDEDFG